MKKIFPYLAGAGASGLSSQFSALAPFQAAIGAGAGALANKKNRLAGAAQGLAGGAAGSTLAGGAKNMFSGGNFGEGAMSGIKSYGNSIPGFAGVGTSNPTGVFAKAFSGPNTGTLNTRPFAPPNLNNSAGSMSLINGGIGNVSGQPVGSNLKFSLPTSSTPRSSFMPTTAGTGGTTPTGSMSAMDMFKSIIPGVGVAAAGSLLAPKVPAPDYSGVKNDLMSRVEQGGNPAARSAALNQYLSTVNAPEGASAEAGVANARLINERQKAEAQKALEQQFRANNGNIMGNSAYNDALTKSNSTYDQNYAAQAAQLQFEYDNQQKAQKMAAANALQGMDDTQLQYYAGLAGLDVMQIQEKTGMDVASANAIKQISQTAGELLMQKSLGLGGAR